MGKKTRIGLQQSRRRPILQLESDHKKEDRGSGSEGELGVAGPARLVKGGQSRANNTPVGNWADKDNPARCRHCQGHVSLVTNWPNAARDPSPTQFHLPVRQQCPSKPIPSMY